MELSGFGLGPISGEHLRAVQRLLTDSEAGGANEKSHHLF